MNAVQFNPFTSLSDNCLFSLVGSIVLAVIIVLVRGTRGGDDS